MSEIQKENRVKMEDKLPDNNSSIFCKIVRFFINILTNILIVVTVAACLAYACSQHIGKFQLHIICCVLGYQFLMCQGALAVSKYNIFTFACNRRTCKIVHKACVIAGIILIVVGCSLMYSMQANFKSAHAITAIMALVLSLITFIDGIGFFRTYRYSHFVTGILTLYLSAVCLCFGFDMSSFKAWTGVYNCMPYVLMAFTISFTTFVALDFFSFAMRNFVTY